MADEFAKDARRRRFGRFALVGFGLLALAVLAGPPALRAWIERDLCPTVVTKSGDADGTHWEIARSDCGGRRIVHQLRIVPPKGWSTLVYETEGGSLPVSWSQAGFIGKLELDHPLEGEADLVLDVPLDAKGRPKAAIRVRAGRRLAVP
ncbi:MAG: hypothetical protein GX458_12715 [Phyllobacteriaceae bacterium]|nr:hypothetical protein [Phyllobacteriaceae bacterium]